MSVSRKRQPMTFDDTFKYRQFSNGYMYLKEGGESANTDTYNFIQTNKDKFLSTLSNIAQKNFAKEQRKMQNGGVNPADWAMEDPNKYLNQMMRFGLDYTPGKQSYIKEINQYAPDGTLEQNLYTANDRLRDNDTLYSFGEGFSQYTDGVNVSGYENVTNPKMKPRPLFQYAGTNPYASRNYGTQQATSPDLPFISINPDSLNIDSTGVPTPSVNEQVMTQPSIFNTGKQTTSDSYRITPQSSYSPDYMDFNPSSAENKNVNEWKTFINDAINYYKKRQQVANTRAQEEYDQRQGIETMSSTPIVQPSTSTTPSTQSQNQPTFATNPQTPATTPGGVKTATSPKSTTTQPQKDNNIPGGIREGVKPTGTQTPGFAGTTTDDSLSYLDQYNLKGRTRRPIGSSQDTQQQSSPTPGRTYGVTSYHRDRDRKGLFKRNNSHIFTFGYLEPMQVAEQQAQNSIPKTAEESRQSPRLTQEGDLWKRPDYLLPDDYGTGARLQKPMQGPLLLPGQENNVGNVNQIQKMTPLKPPTFKTVAPSTRKIVGNTQISGAPSNDEFSNVFKDSNRELLKRQIEDKGLNPNDFELIDLGSGQYEHRPKMAKGGKYEYGGTNPYIDFYMQQGGEYYLSESDIEYIKKCGGQIEYLD